MEPNELKIAQWEWDRAAKRTEEWYKRCAERRDELMQQLKTERGALKFVNEHVDFTDSVYLEKIFHIVATAETTAQLALEVQLIVRAEIANAAARLTERELG